MINLLASLTWDPGVRGVLTVAVAIVILMGSVFLLLATNSGPRLGFLIAVTALFGWLTLMGTTWTIYGIGKKGVDPTWSVKEINYNNLDVSGLEKAHGLPEPSKLPDPESYLKKDPALAAQFKPVPGVKRPGLGDLLSVDPSLEKDIKQKANLPKCWELLASSDSQTGEANASASNYVIATRKLFTAQSDFVIQADYSCGGKDKGNHPHCAPLSSIRSYGGCFRRLGFKIKRTLTWPLGNPPHYAVVQLQAVVPQVTPPGQPPPLPVADPKANVVSVVMERNLGNRRLPAVGVTVFSAIVFGLGCNSLHRRDKLVAKARAAAAKG